jgi:hypothetical protein
LGRISQPQGYPEADAGGTSKRCFAEHASNWRRPANKKRQVVLLSERITMSESDDRERLNDLLVSLPQKAETLTIRVGELSAKVGYVAGAVRTFADAHRTLLESPVESTAAVQFIASGAVIASELDTRLDQLLVGTETFGQLIDPAIPVFSTSSSSAVATCNSICLGPVPVRFSPCPYLDDSDEKAYSRKLELLDASLAGTYRGAWHALYAEAHDPGRPSLWQMRQVMDHFFGLLAPDDKVRQSIHWSRKSGNKPEGVHRAERWRYAADRWLGDPQLRNVFVESVREIDHAYETLNQAHKRGALDRARAEETFRAADAVVRRWIDGIDPWPPDVTG